MDAARRRFLLRGAPAAAPGGRARVAAHCLAQRRIECRVCGEACDTGAIRFVPQAGGIARPRIDAGRCSGCAACVTLCPVQAITLIARDAVAECAAR